MPPIIFWRSNKDIADLLEVDITTVRRWRRGAICPPRAVVLLLSADIGVFDPEWRGWKARGGQLVSPEGWSITVGEVLAVPLMRAQIAAYQGENRKLKERIDSSLHEQPKPADWEVKLDYG